MAFIFKHSQEIKPQKIKSLPKETEGLTQVKKQRFVKINPHKFFKEYDLSIWVDGNVVIKGDLNEFVSKTLKDYCSVYVPKHPTRNCLYSEETAVLRIKKDKPEITNPQIERYKKEGFPKNYGLLQSNILLRKHNNPECIKLMEDWFKEVKNGSHRDQLSFNYVSWKNERIRVFYMDKNICNSTWFKWKAFHHRAKPVEKKDTTKVAAKKIEKKTYIKPMTSQPRKPKLLPKFLTTMDINLY